jgi:dihydropteroate synthase
MLWKTRTRTLDLSRRALIMGVLNITPDSFSDAGQFADTESAVEHGRQMAAEGAVIIDIGGESTRPGAEPVPEEEELRRVLPVIERLGPGRTGGLGRTGESGIILSIDTMKPGVAQAALEAGAEIVNDVTGLRDPAMREVVRASGAGAIAMHMQGTPRDMQVAPHYDDVVAEILNFFRQTFSTCLACGIDPMQLAFDPGIGFGKTVEHNLALLRKLDAMRVGGRDGGGEHPTFKSGPDGHIQHPTSNGLRGSELRPLVLGVSRKSFLGKLGGEGAGSDRLWPTVALTSFGRSRGVNVFRVHEVRPNFEALRMTEAIIDEEAAA